MECTALRHLFGAAIEEGGRIISLEGHTWSLPGELRKSSPDGWDNEPQTEAISAIILEDSPYLTVHKELTRRPRDPGPQRPNNNPQSEVIRATMLEDSIQQPNKNPQSEVIRAIVLEDSLQRPNRPQSEVISCCCCCCYC